MGLQDRFLRDTTMYAPKLCILCCWATSHISCSSRLGISPPDPGYVQVVIASTCCMCTTRRWLWACLAMYMCTEAPLNIVTLLQSAVSDVQLGNAGYKLLDMPWKVTFSRAFHLAAEWRACACESATRCASSDLCASVCRSAIGFCT